MFIGQGALDVVAVRDARERSDGHILCARRGALEGLGGDARMALPRGGVVFIFTRGKRSLTAAKLAEASGFEKLQVDGGTICPGPLVRS